MNASKNKGVMYCPLNHYQVPGKSKRYRHVQEKLPSKFATITNLFMPTRHNIEEKTMDDAIKAGE